MVPFARLRSLGVSLCLSMFFASAAWPAQVNDNFILLSRTDTYTQYADCWGYRDPATGKEYALLTSTTKLSVWNVTDPFNPYETGSWFYFQQNAFRDVTTYGDHAYGVAQGQGNGLMVIDLANPESPVLVTTIGSWTARSARVDSTAGVLYAVGWHPTAELTGPPDDTDDVREKLNPARAFYALNVASNPDNPPVIVEHVDPYFHDMYVRNGVAYGAAYDNGGRLDILRVTNLPAVSVKASITYPSGRAHSTWLTDDGDYCLIGDEMMGGKVRVFDVSDTSFVTQVGQFPAIPTTSVHEVVVKGSVAYCAWFQGGLIAFDISNPASPVQIGSYDTAGPDTLGTIGPYAGCYGVYPFLPSGVVIASDINRGMHLLYYSALIGTLSGTVTDLTTGAPISGASARVPSFFNRTVTTSGAGDYSATLPGGMRTVIVSKAGYFPDTTSVNITDGAVTDLDVALVPTSATGLAPGTTHAPAEVKLAEPAPKPSRSDVRLTFELPRPSDVAFVLYDASGRHVRTLASGFLSGGRHELTWDGRDDAGRLVANGAFIARLAAGGTVRSTKLVLAR